MADIESENAPSFAICWSSFSAFEEDGLFCDMFSLTALSTEYTKNNGGVLSDLYVTGHEN
jgi:hypothetical protein